MVLAVGVQVCGCLFFAAQVWTTVRAACRLVPIGVGVLRVLGFELGNIDT